MIELVIQDKHPLRKEIEALWELVPEHKKREIHGIFLEWDIAVVAGKNTTLLHQVGKDWCEENGFERNHWYSIYTKEVNSNDKHTNHSSHPKAPRIEA